MIYPVDEVVACKLCGVKRLWTRPAEDSTPPSWCKGHENRSKRAKYLCPTPNKTRHSTKEQAVGSAAYQNNKCSKGLTTYLCKCTYWHLTSRTESRLAGK